MKITGSHCWVQHFHFKESYSIAYHQDIDQCHNVFLALETDEGLIGCGMAAPDMKVTGEDAESVLNTYHSHIESCMKGEDPFYFSRLYEELREAIPGQSSALAMVEIALYDLVAQKAGVPLYKLLGGFRDKIITSVTVGIMEEELALERVKKLIKNDIKAIKIKGG